jgi:hypothetical protein
MMLSLPCLFVVGTAAVEPALRVGIVYWPHCAADSEIYRKSTNVRLHTTFPSPSRPDLPKQMPLCGSKRSQDLDKARHDRPIYRRQPTKLPMKLPSPTSAHPGTRAARRALAQRTR